MSVAALYNIPTTPEEMQVWAFAHMAHHRNIVDALENDGSGELPIFVLDPVDPKNSSAFLYQHQIMHNNTDALLGIGGYDLTDVDLSDQEQLASWIFLNATLHYAEASALGVW